MKFRLHIGGIVSNMSSFRKTLITHSSIERLLKELEVEDSGTIEGQEFDTGRSLTGKHNVKIINCTFKSNKEDEDQLHLSGCQGCIILKCTFRGKHNAGLALNIDGENSKNNWVVACTFLTLYSAIATRKSLRGNMVKQSMPNLSVLEVVRFLAAGLALQSAGVSSISWLLT